MKKVSIISFLIIAIGFKTIAQSQTTQDFDSLSNKKTIAYPKHEIGFSVGAFPIIGFLNPDGSLPGVIHLGGHTYYEEWGNDYEKMYCLGSYTLNYNYHFNSKHSIGISLSWVGQHIDTYWIYTPSLFANNADTVDGSGWKHYFTLQGNYRYTYYHKSKISLYWSIHGGITLCIRDKDILPKETIHGLVGSINNDRYYFSPPALQLNAFGLEIGEKYVFNMELGIGTQGLAKIGFKYKF